MAEIPERQPINFKQHDELWVTLNKAEARIRELEQALRQAEVAMCGNNDPFDIDAWSLAVTAVRAALQVADKAAQK